MELAPDNTMALNNVGAAYFRMKKADDAAALWTRSMEIRPTNSAASNLGSYYYLRGRYADAARQFEQAVAIPPTRFLLWGNLAAALYWAPGERDKSTAAYQKSIELAEEARRLNPRQIEVLATLADSYSVLRQRAKALDAIAAIERLDARDRITLSTVANAFEQMGDREQALKWMEKAIAAGYDAADIERSPWLESLRKDKRLVQMLKKAQTTTK
jgi:tetratricopeptide (TPR) repeat protein